jgi:hypothetical protein
MPSARPRQHGRFERVITILAANTLLLLQSTTAIKYQNPFAAGI